MAKQFSNIPEHDFSRGIDARSSENLISPGFVEDALNADVVENRLRKRNGYEGHAGCIPLRVKEIERLASENKIKYTFEDSIDLTDVRSTPIIIYGRGSDAGASPVDSEDYYASFEATAKLSFPALSETTRVVEQDAHGFSSFSISQVDFFPAVHESTSLVNTSNSTVISESISVNSSTVDVSATLDNTTASDKSAFISFLDITASNQLIYAFVGGINNVLFPNLNGFRNGNLIPKFYEKSGTDLIEFFPDGFRINNFGRCFLDIAGPGVDLLAAVYAAPDTNIRSGTIAAGATTTISISASSPFLSIAIYLRTASELQLVQPQSIEYDAEDNLHRITFQNDSSDTLDFECYYDYGQVRTNFLTVDETVSVDETFTNPQATVWGLCQGSVYGSSKDSREGWTTHIDSYRRPSEERLVAGLGGNLFVEREDFESPLTHPTIAVSIFNDVNGQTKVSPLIHDNGETPGRSRGYWTYDKGSDNRAEITDVAYVSGNLVNYTLNVPGLQLFDSSDTLLADQTDVDAAISTTLGFEDLATITNCGHSRLNGTFKIKNVTLSAVDTIVVQVENENISTADYDETDVGGLLGVFTDVVPTTLPGEFIEGDRLISDVFGDDDVISVLASSPISNEVLIQGITSTVVVSNALDLKARRTTSLLPSGNVSNVVVGDTLAISGYTRRFQVKAVNTLSDISISIAPPAFGENEATITMASGDTNGFKVGDRIMLLRAGDYSGEQVISSISALDQLKFETTETEAATGATLLGRTIEIDESLEIEHDSQATVPKRWIPVEAPVDAFSTTEKNYYRYFDSKDYEIQDFIRSTIVSDTLFMTNGEDEVLKFDGSSIYRAGLPAWQPDVMIKQDTTSVDKISVANDQANVSEYSGRRFTVGLGEEASFSSGQSVIYDGNTYIVDKVESGDTEGYVFVTTSITGAATGTLGIRGIFSYYLRLNLVDANQNLIASRVVRNEDLKVDLGQDASVNMKISGFPQIGNYDYIRMELEIYRTKQDTPAPYYKLITIPIDYDASGKAILFRDSEDDSTLTEFSLDPVNSAILGSELGTQWSEPLRAKYLTSASNSLVLANVRDYDELRINFQKDGKNKLTFNSVSSINSGGTLTQPEQRLFTFSNGTESYSYWFDLAGADTVLEDKPVRYSSGEISFDGSGGNIVVGDWVYIFDPDTPFGNTYDNISTPFGWFQVSRINGSLCYIKYENDLLDNGVTRCNILLRAGTLPVGTVPILAAIDENRETLDLSSSPSEGSRRLIAFLLAEAINATMAWTDTSIAGQENFKPFMLAYSDGSFPNGELIVRSPIAGEQITFTAPSEFHNPDDTSATYRMFVNGLEISEGSTSNGLTRVFPSRVLVSYENFPEIFDNPTAILPSDSDSVIDINPADGQEITGVIPFFGDAAFGAAQKSNIVVVFKTNSIYLIDINEKRQGRDPVQRIESEGLGCTAPYSIAVTREGIMFANEAGIYRLRRDLKIEYIGRFMERFWLEAANRDQLEIMQGHHYGIGRRYKLSLPISNAVENSDVYVYHHTGEFGETPGAWTRYDNHPATGWANLAQDAYFATTDGRVLKIRREDDLTDFRDDDQAISMSFLTRAMDLGNAGMRKVFAGIVGHYRTIIESLNTKVRFGVDLEEELQDTDAFVIDRPEDDGLSTRIANKIQTIFTAFGRRKGVYIQVEISNDGKDEPLDVGGIDVRAALLNARGIKQARGTTD